MFVRGLIAVGMSLALQAGSAAGQEALQQAEEERAVYPAAEWAKAPFPGGVRENVEALIDDAMSREVADVMGESRQIVVIHKGRLVAEAYREGFAPETKLVSWSMAKSITQALVGRAVMEGLIEDIDAPMPGPWTEGDPRSEITWRQWMMMVDGLDYIEVGETDLAKNDVVQMMFGPGRFDVVDYAAELEQVHPVGTHWNYSTAAYHLISSALQWEVISAFHWQVRDPFDYAKTKWLNETLFTPLGMDAQPEFDASGTFLGGSLVYASARDFARFGYLYLRDGVWNGERLLPEGWVDFARRPHEGTGSNVYGAGWWITPPEGETPTHPQSAKSAPYDAYHAGGNEGQTIWVVPSKDLVIVRLGLMSNAPENWAALFEWNQEVARAFPDVE